MRHGKSFNNTERATRGRGERKKSSSNWICRDDIFKLFFLLRTHDDRRQVAKKQRHSSHESTERNVVAQPSLKWTLCRSRARLSTYSKKENFPLAAEIFTITNTPWISNNALAAEKKNRKEEIHFGAVQNRVLMACGAIGCCFTVRYIYFESICKFPYSLTSASVCWIPLSETSTSAHVPLALSELPTFSILYLNFPPLPSVWIVVRIRSYIVHVVDAKIVFSSHFSSSGLRDGEVLNILWWRAVVECCLFLRADHIRQKREHANHWHRIWQA